MTSKWRHWNFKNKLPPSMSLFKNLTSIFYWVIVAQILGHQVDRVFLNLSSVSSCHLMWGSYSSCALTSAQVTARTSRWPLPFPASSLQTTHLRHTLLPPHFRRQACWKAGAMSHSAQSIHSHVCIKTFNCLTDFGVTWTSISVQN